jgi:hypothetical protein
MRIRIQDPESFDPGSLIRERKNSNTESGSATLLNTVKLIMKGLLVPSKKNTFPDT